MQNASELIWQISTKGTLDQIRQHLQAGVLVAKGARNADIATTKALSSNVLRSKDGLIEAHILIHSDPDDLIEAVREHWVILRDKGLAEALPIKIFVTADSPNTVIYVFRWKSSESRTIAQSDSEVVEAWNRAQQYSVAINRFSALNEIYQGFDHRQFPKTGSIELLRGKCTCTLRMHGFDESIELDGRNGFVIMHRGPALEVDSTLKLKLMPVVIVAHGADVPNPFTRDLRFQGQIQFTEARLRVEQNTELPQFGIIRAQQPESDFPATAMWVVHWKIHTPIGTIITDPNVPLVFGPTTVYHYPPVGTEFKSAIGPVDVYDVETNQVVGTLQPGELTAFDIVVTMDDEIPSIMDYPPITQLEMFNKYVSDENLKIPLTEYSASKWGAHQRI